MNVHVQAVLAKPAQAGIGGGPTIFVFFETSEGAVVNDFALLVTPAAVDDLADGDFVDVARDHAIDELGGVFASDQILVERRDVDERTSVADGVVLVLVVHFVHADRVVSRPLAVVEALAEGKGSFVKSGSDGHKGFFVRQNVKSDYMCLTV